MNFNQIQSSNCLGLYLASIAVFLRHIYDLFHIWVRLITFPWFQWADKYDYHSIYKGSVGNVLSREICLKINHFNSTSVQGQGVL